MVETDWREILQYSQKELTQADKENLCESLSWMEADDIELNFTDLKTFFRLAQDILKFKTEQVNNLLGKIETLSSQRKGGKKKSKTYLASPTLSNDSALETITHQEEVIKANKEILEQLYSDIAELEARKHKLEEDGDRESESSRDALSEINALAQLESEMAMKNKHIRKLLADVKILEEENTVLKENVSEFKEKLSEATEIIENLTQQLLNINNEQTKLKETLAKSEQMKSDLSYEMESLRKELFDKQYNKENFYEEIKSKALHWKNVARSKKAELEALFSENSKLKEELTSRNKVSPKKIPLDELMFKELQTKLAEATEEIIKSARLIESLKSENLKLTSLLEVTTDHSADNKNESDDGKERALIYKLKRKVKTLSVALHGAEETIANREKELAEIAAQLEILKTDEGIKALLVGIKSKKQQLKIKDEGIKSLVQEVNTLNQSVSDLQLENEAMRRKLNIEPNTKIETKGIMKKYQDYKNKNVYLEKMNNKNENKLVTMELDKRAIHSKLAKLSDFVQSLGYTKNEVDDIIQYETNDNVYDATEVNKENIKQDECSQEVQQIIDENEGLRKALQEVLQFLKDNSSTSSGILALQSPSLEAILRSMDARRTAGWLAPHMTAVMELKEAVGGKDALLTALHEARHETFTVMNQLQKETQKATALEQKVSNLESQNKTELTSNVDVQNDSEEFGEWISENQYADVDLYDLESIENVIAKGNNMYENHLKIGLSYFHAKFSELFDKMCKISIQASDSQNNWLIQEEQYKAQIENFKAKLKACENEDSSDISPGVVEFSSFSVLERKCSYLEESYKYIRTLNENIKNEYLDSKKDSMAMAADYEAQNQKLILAIAKLTDKLRNSISIDVFWKQNKILSDVTTKYRKLNEQIANKHDILNVKPKISAKRLEYDKIEKLNTIGESVASEKQTNNILANIEQSILQKQLEEICFQIEDKDKKISQLEKKYIELQENQTKLIDNSLSSLTKEEEAFMKEQISKLGEENNTLQDHSRLVEEQLEISLSHLQDWQQKQMCNDMEINMLRHQILDLQSTSDNKAIVARLSGEVLIAHLQASENHKTIERQSSSLKKEKQLRIEAEEMLKAREKIFNIYSARYESKLRYSFEILQVLRQQYQGSIPLISLENYVNNVEDATRNTCAVNAKLDEIEDLRESLMAKHSIFDQILDVSKNKCFEEENCCQHKLKNIVMHGVHARESDHFKKRIQSLEMFRENILKQYNDLEKTLVLINQGFEKFEISSILERRNPTDLVDLPNLELEDILSDDDSASSRNSRTITLPKPQILKPTDNNIDMTTTTKQVAHEQPIKASFDQQQTKIISIKNAQVQTNKTVLLKSKLVQTDQDAKINKLNELCISLQKENEKKTNEIAESLSLARKRTEDNLKLNADKVDLEITIQTLHDAKSASDKLNEKLHATIEDLRKQLETLKFDMTKSNKEKTNSENTTFLNALKQLENDKNSIIDEYKNLLQNEREEYAKSMKDMQVKIIKMQSEIDRRASDSSSNNAEVLKTIVGKYSIKISELENKCFQLQSEVDNHKSETSTYQCEVERWKELASERLIKMEQLNSQLHARHAHEVDTYKAENQHWLSQLSDNQKEQMELRSKLTEQKTTHLKQLSDKDAQIEQLKSIAQNLKSQIMNMQTIVSINDPSFDLSAIVEVDEASDLSQKSLEALELKFDSSVDLQDLNDDVRIPATSTVIWQEPIIDRLRREKQLATKQNMILRRQIKALAARERRSRLDAQNLKNQIYRISSSGSKVTSAETAALHHKIATLQTQLTSARRETHSTVALWDKWKRAQQSSDRWQARYEEKCQEERKLDSSLQLAKSAVVRLEKEKRVLMSRLNEVKQEKQRYHIEKQDEEYLEKIPQRECPLSEQTLLNRVEAQQRTIVALQASEKGNEYLVSEYEKALAEITSLKGQVLKLESTLLECQIRIPISNNDNQQPEIDYWKNYCDMLKEENVQLTLRVNSLESAPTTANQHRVNDLEQTVLTLRGLVSKLQAEQKAGVVPKRVDSRPNSSRSYSDRGKAQLEPYRIEITNLKRTILDKDLLLERSKEMLNIAAEREDELLRENNLIRRQLKEVTKSSAGFLSA